MKKLFFTVTACLALCAWCGAEDSLVFVSRTKLSGYSWGITEKEIYYYVPNRGSISIVNITDPFNPIHVKNHDALTNPLALFVVDTILFCRGGSGFVTINISDPVNPQNLSWRLLTGSPEGPKGLFVLNNNCYVARAADGFNIYDVSNPAIPESIGVYDTPVGCEDLFVRDSLAYVADYDSLQIINISRPDSCFRVGAIGMHWGCTGITVNGNYAYCASRGDWGVDGRLVAVDISNPANPITVDSVYSIMGNPITAYYANNRVYSIAADYFAKKGKDQTLPIGAKEKADIEGGLRVINIIKPDSLFYTCGFNTFSDPRDAVADSQYVYIADQDSGLIILRHNHYTGVGGKPYEVNLMRKMRLTLSPNPTRGSFDFQYTVPEPGMALINIYNMTGQLVRTLVDGHKRAGKHTVIWNGKADNGQSVSSGNYLCRYVLNGKHTTQKAIVVR